MLDNPLSKRKRYATNESGDLEEAGLYRTVQNQVDILASKCCISRLDVCPFQIGSIFG
jgi:hypothetical protein